MIAESKGDRHREILREQGFTEEEIDRLWALSSEITDRLEWVVKLFKEKREKSRPEEPICDRLEVVLNTIFAIIEEAKKIIWHRTIILFFTQQGKEEKMYS